MANAENLQHCESTTTPAYVWLTLFFALALIVFLVVFLFKSDVRSNENIGGADGILGGDFVLQSVNGSVELEDFRGKVVLMYFGFLSCPEVCPASMGIFQKTLQKMTAEEREQIQPLLISIDPARDTVEELAEFSAYFDSQIIGLTGTEQALRAVADDYGAFYQVAPVKASEKAEQGYLFDHTSRYYVVDQQGELVDAMRHSTTANELAARVRLLL